MNKFHFIDTWIDVCPTDSNLLASGGSDKSVKIYDKRESKIVKTIDNIHSSKICFIVSA